MPTMRAQSRIMVQRMVRRGAARPFALPQTVLTLASLALIAGCDITRDDASRVKTVFGGAGMGRGEFNYPRGLAVSPVDGRVFAIDKAARVQRFDPDGKYETEWRMPEFTNGKPTGLFVDSQNRVWVPDTHYSRVIVYDRDGRELFRFGRNGTGPGEFIWPTNLIVDAEGNAYVGEFGGNDRINKFSPTHEFLLSFAHGETEVGGTARPQGLAFDRDGVLWVADSAHHRLCRFTKDGKFLGAFGTMGDGPGEFRYPYHVAVRPDQTLLVCDYGNNRVVQMTRDGKMLRTWGSVGRQTGQICHPWTIDLARDGLVYVLDSWNNRVQVIKW